MRVRYEVSPGVDPEAGERLLFGAAEFATSADEGSVGNCVLPIDDPDGDFEIRGLQYLHAIEDEAVSDPYGGILYVGYTRDRDTERGPYRTGPSAWHNIQLTDTNTLLSWRVVIDFNRPEETDVQRMAAFMATANMNWLGDDLTYVDTTGGVMMDAVDYSGQMALDVIQDCALASGRDYFLFWLYSGDPEHPVLHRLWYKYSGDTAYASDIRISNVMSDVDGETTFYPDIDAKRNRSPNKLYSGMLGQGDGFSRYGFKQQTRDRHARRDVVERMDNVKTAAMMDARIQTRLNAISVELDTIDVTILVKAPMVNAVMAGHRIQVRFSHISGYRDDFQWMRVRDRAVRQVGILDGEVLYSIHMTLKGPSLEDLGEDTSTPVSGLYALLSGASGPYPKPAGALYWDKTGDEVGLPHTLTQGGFTYSDSPVDWPPYDGIVIPAGIATVDVVMTASVIGIINGDQSPYLISWEICLNGAAVAGETVTWSTDGLEQTGDWGPTVSVSGLAVAEGDVLSGYLSASPEPAMFRSPLGVNPGVNNNRLEITGGTT